MVSEKKSSALKEIQKILKSKSGDGRKIKYQIPSYWVKYSNSGGKNLNVNPFLFYKSKIDEVLKFDSPIVNKSIDAGGNWSKRAIVYNIFVRLTTAYDHNNNGIIDLPLNETGWRETGTFLKTIALLPYIKKMGVNTLHFLPITSIGHDGNKGTLGSPYAIRNPYKIDENLSEPILDREIDFQFKALIEAAKRMGFRIILEFVFRTASKDSDWIPEHPEWFYWIKDEIEIRDPQNLDENKYGSPLFTSQQLQKIHHLVEEKNFDALVEPNDIYQQMFTKIPVKVEFLNQRYIGETHDGLRVKIPGAFADWPPDDNQPPWNDVTYLRMYNHQNYNYIAYNTIRMYDSNLAKYENRNKPLWEKIINIIPHYQSEFKIDGVMIDMGHALPPELLKAIVKKAREINPCFAFWEENFSLTKKSIEQGYNITLGYLWCDEYHPEKLKSILQICATSSFPLPFFSTSETHNTPRSVSRKGGVLFSKYSFAINCFLPAIVFIHSGFELGVDYPVNTGLDFSNEDLKKYPSEKLPLFSESSYNWNCKDQFIDYEIRLLKIRKKYFEIVIDSDPKSFEIVLCKNSNIIAFLRKSQTIHKKVVIIANSNFESEEYCEIKIADKNYLLNDWIENEKVILKNGVYKTVLMPGEVKILGN